MPSPPLTEGVAEISPVSGGVVPPVSEKVKFSEATPFSPERAPSETPPNKGAPSSLPFCRSTYICCAFDNLGFFSPVAALDQQMFDQALNLSGMHQYKFVGINLLSQVLKKAINQHTITDLNWNKLLDLCQSTPSTFGAFISKHSQLLSYGNVVEYLNPALFITGQ